MRAHRSQTVAVADNHIRGRRRLRVGAAVREPRRIRTCLPDVVARPASYAPSEPPHQSTHVQDRLTEAAGRTSSHDPQDPGQARENPNETAKRTSQTPGGCRATFQRTTRDRKADELPSRPGASALAPPSTTHARPRSGRAPRTRRSIRSNASREHPSRPADQVSNARPGQLAPRHDTATSHRPCGRIKRTVSPTLRGRKADELPSRPGAPDRAPPRSNRASPQSG